MDIESQKFMALEGIRTWASGTINFATACDQFMIDINSDNYVKLRREFEVNRHCFLISAFKLIEHVEWALHVGAVDEYICDDIIAHAEVIKIFRDLNEHKLEYFKGIGKRQSLWIQEKDGGFCDASATFETKIGGILDWQVIARISEKLINIIDEQ
jgi:hypothetical protein